jgi:hypothetical protein
LPWPIDQSLATGLQALGMTVTEETFGWPVLEAHRVAGGTHPAVPVPGADIDLPPQGPAGHAGGLSHDFHTATTTPTAYHRFKPWNVGRWSSGACLRWCSWWRRWCSRAAWRMTMLSQMGIAIIACLAYNMLLGQGGMLSFGHAVYSGLGSFLAIHTLNLVSKGKPAAPGQPDPAGGRAGIHVLFAVLLGYVTTKKAGTTFAMITWASASWCGRCR